MKTTVVLDDQLFRAAREHARLQGTTLTALISDALRRVILEEPVPTDFRLHLPVTHGRRLPTVDVDSSAVLEEYLDRREQQPDTPS